jgi:hypothetical protein
VRISTIGYEILIEGIECSAESKNIGEKRSRQSAEIAVRSVSTLNISPRIVAHKSVQPHLAWNIARLKRETPPSARELFPPPIRRINLYAALRNQAKEATPDARCSVPRVLGKRPRLCAADRDETEG